MADEALKRRMFEAQQRREAVLGRRLTLAEIGQGVAARLGGEPAAPSVVRRWLKGVEPKEAVATYRALAAVFGVSASWLAFGEGSPEPVAPAPETAPPQPPSREEVAGAMKKLNERTEPYRQAAARKKPKARGG